MLIDNRTFEINLKDEMTNEDDLENDLVGQDQTINAIIDDDQEDSNEDPIKEGCLIGGIVLPQASNVKIVF